MRKVLLFTVVLAFVFASAAGAADISGTWAVKMKSPMGEDEPFTITIKAAGENLTISSTDHPKLAPLEGTGTLKGDAVTMDLKSGGQMAIELKLTGTVASKEMTGTREFVMGQGGAPGGEGGGAREGGTPPEGMTGGPQGGQGGTPPEGAAPPGGEASAASAESAGPGGAPGGAQGEVSNVFTASMM